MESTDLEVLRSAVQWLDQGWAVHLATVAATWGSSPRPPGSLAAFRADGRVTGSVSGGCVETDLAERVRTDPPVAVTCLTYGLHAEETRRFGLPCGGRLELVLEPLPGPAPLRELVRVMEARELCLRRLCLGTGEASLHPARPDQGFRYDSDNLEKVFGPQWQLLIIGTGQLARYLADLARGLDYRVIVCDPRAEQRAAWDLPGTELDPGMPDDVVRARADDPRSAVVALTHDPKLDDMALMEALDSRAFYVGALGARASNDRRRRRLAELGVSAAGLDRLHGPVGLPLGSRTPPEIAVAIAAELVALRHGVQLYPGECEPVARAQGLGQ